MAKLRYTPEGYPYYEADKLGELAPPAPQTLVTGVEPQGSFLGLSQMRDRGTGVTALDKLFGLGGQERYQLWPEKMVRSAISLPGDVATGKVPVVDESGHTSLPVIERTQDLANLAMGGSVPFAGGTVNMGMARRLSDEEGKSVVNYIKEGYKAVNKALRGQGEVTPKTQEQLNFLDEAIKQGITDKDRVLYRGLETYKKADRALLDQFKEGETLTFDPYTSTTADAKIARDQFGTNWADSSPGIMMKINVPKGSNALDLKEALGHHYRMGEGETILPRGSQFRVNKVKPVGDKGAEVELTLVAPKARGKIDPAASRADEAVRYDGPSLPKRVMRGLTDHLDTIGLRPANVKHVLRQAIRREKDPEVKKTLQSLTSKNFSLRSGLGDEGAMPATAPLGQLAANKAPVWHSAVENAVERMTQKSATPDQWLNTLRNSPGVRQEELDWLGLSDLAGRKEPLTKQEVKDIIDANRVEVKDALNTNKEAGEYGAFQDAIGDLGGLLLYAGEKPQVIPQGGHYLLKVGDHVIDHFGSKAAAEAEAARLNPNSIDPSVLRDWSQRIASRESRTGSGRYSEYQLPGGENYNELLLTLPNNKSDLIKKFRASKRSGQMLSDDELRSLPKAGENYISSHWDEPNVLAHVRFNERNIDGKKTLFLEEVQSDWHQEGRKRGYKGEPLDGLPPGYQIRETKPSDWTQAQPGSGSWTITDPKGDMVPIHKPGASREAIIQEFLGDLDKRRLPDAPFKKTWPELALKRMIRYAAENGYDAIAWTPGEVQAKRWKGTGEAGHKKFYDEMLVNAANKLAKGHKGKTEAKKLDGGQSVHFLELPETMRNTALSKGMPLFSGGNLLIPVGPAVSPEVQKVIDRVNEMLKENPNAT